MQLQQQEQQQELSSAEQLAADQRVWDEEAAAIDQGETPPAPAAEETAAPETPAAGEPGSETAASDVQAEADPLAGVPESVRHYVESISVASKAAITELTQHVKSAEGRVAAMARQLQEVTAAKAATPAPGGPTSAQIDGAKKDPESWAKLKEDFPEWASGVEDYVKANQGAQQFSAEELERQRKETIAQATRAAADVMREELVEARHAGWKNVVQTTEFKAWFGQQPPETQKLAESAAPADAIALLDSFRDARKSKTPAQIEAERQARLRRNTSVKGQQSASLDIDPGAMTDDQYWEYLAKQNQAA